MQNSPQPTTKPIAFLSLVSGYLTSTRAPRYTLLLVLPFLLIYEFGIMALGLSFDAFLVRNGADAIIRSLLFPFKSSEIGIVWIVVWSLFPCGLMGGAYYFYERYEKKKNPTLTALPVRAHNVLLLFVESGIWALMLFFASQLAFKVLLSTQGVSIKELAAQVVLNAGAGVYEEFVFRIVLVGVLAMFFTQVIHLERRIGILAAIVTSAVIFSLAHFGASGEADPWGGEHFWPLFVFRAVAGLWFSLLVYYRSFGVAVASHAIYDNIVTFSMLMR